MASGLSPTTDSRLETASATTLAGWAGGLAWAAAGASTASLSVTTVCAAATLANDAVSSCADSDASAVTGASASTGSAATAFTAVRSSVSWLRSTSFLDDARCGLLGLECSGTSSSDAGFDVEPADGSVDGSVRGSSFVVAGALSVVLSDCGLVEPCAGNEFDFATPSCEAEEFEDSDTPDEADDDGSDEADPSSSAHAIPGLLAIAAPMPSATARAPMRPMNRAQPSLVGGVIGRQRDRSSLGIDIEAHFLWRNQTFGSV